MVGGGGPFAGGCLRKNNRGALFPSLAPQPKSPSLPFRAPLSLIPVSIKIINLHRFFYILLSTRLRSKRF